MPSRALCLLLALAALAARASAIDVFDISAEEYYAMPKLFHLDEYDGCLATRGVYCLGSFELAPPHQHHHHHHHHRLYQLMQLYSSNWVDNFNHTRLHRGLCVSRRCAPAPATITTTTTTTTPSTSNYTTAPAPGTTRRASDLQTWFAGCVNASTISSYNLSAHLYRLEYCRRGPGPAPAPLEAAARALPAVLAALVLLAAASTVLDLMLADETKKGYQWALCWSVPACWRALLAAPSGGGASDLRAFDGIRVFCMMCVIVEHVCWLSTLSYLADVRYFEMVRRASDVMLMTNSTLVVQIFFLMSSFLLAHKVLLQRSRTGAVPPFSSFFRTMFNRIIRVSPSYYFVVWVAATWWSRLGAGGPLWGPLVEAESAVCRRKWWTHLLYLNNVLYPDDKCLIQTWYLAADMQLYAVALLLTLALARWRRGALPVLAALLAGSVALVFGLAYSWSLVSTFVMHNPELVRATYKGESSFNVLYQSPLGNAPGMLAGLLLAFLHHDLLARDLRPQDYRWFRWASWWGAPLALWWAAWSPLLVRAGGGAPDRAPAAALAALERPVFAFFVALALLGAMHGVHAPWVRVFAWRGWAAGARLSFGALLLHMPLNKALVAARAQPTALHRPAVLYEWFGVAVVAYLAALPLALLVELPAQRLQRALEARAAAAPSSAPAHSPRSPPEPPRDQKNNM